MLVLDLEQGFLNSEDCISYIVLGLYNMEVLSSKPFHVSLVSLQTKQASHYITHTVTKSERWCISLL